MKGQRQRLTGAALTLIALFSRVPHLCSTAYIGPIRHSVLLVRMDLDNGCSSVCTTSCTSKAQPAYRNLFVTLCTLAGIEAEATLAVTTAGQMQQSKAIKDTLTSTRRGTTRRALAVAAADASGIWRAAIKLAYTRYGERKIFK